MLFNDKPCGNYTIDRIEGAIAVLLYREDTSKEINLPCTMLPVDAVEGSLLELSLDNQDHVQIKLFLEETESVRKSVEALLQKLRG
ncbi:DUF3006 domain-containing protein [Bacillus sp. SM2101]|uniref:DUF3006 domain-containing protein n=1 Tax=Bacillaceae TaxID=186817 RepID=UPI001BDE72F8|nr:DUF3006 domain-containing protein [Bacillus sp. SM2101]